MSQGAMFGGMLLISVTTLHGPFIDFNIGPRLALRRQRVGTCQWANSEHKAQVFVFDLLKLLNNLKARPETDHRNQHESKHPCNADRKLDSESMCMCD